ncbi:MAG: hypothetical protein HRU11_11790 [Parvularculaceae bacterium]|nr:hypothetical protein [Parvularculaceae bacterium]
MDKSLQLCIDIIESAFAIVSPKIGGASTLDAQDGSVTALISGPHKNQHTPEMGLATSAWLIPLVDECSNDSIEPSITGEIHLLAALDGKDDTQAVQRRLVSDAVRALLVSPTDGLLLR